MALKNIKVNVFSYKGVAKKLMSKAYEIMPVAQKMNIERTKDGSLKATNMTTDELSGEARFQYGIISFSKVAREVAPFSDFESKVKVAVEEEDDRGLKRVHKALIGPDKRYRMYDSIYMVNFGDGVNLDLMSGGFKINRKTGVVSIEGLTPHDEIAPEDAGWLELGVPEWGPNNDKHQASFFFDISKKSRDDWFGECDKLTGEAFNYIFSKKMDIKKAIKNCNRWGNYLTTSIDGPSIDLKEDYVVYVDREQNAAADFKNVPSHVDPGTNIQDGGEKSAAWLWTEWARKEYGLEISERDMCLLAPQARFNVFNTKTMHNIQDEESMNHDIECVKKLYPGKVFIYGNTKGRCALITDSDGAKLPNFKKLKEGNCVIKSVVMNFAKTSSTCTSGQYFNKLTARDINKTKEIAKELYRDNLEEQLTRKVESCFDMNANFADNMLALKGTDALNYKEVATALTKDLFKFGARAISRLNIKIDSVYSHCKFDNTYVKTAGEVARTLGVRYLPEYGTYAVEAYCPDVEKELRNKLDIINTCPDLTDEEKKAEIRKARTCIVIKYPSAGPNEYEIIYYVSKKDITNRIKNMDIDKMMEKELRKYWDRASLGCTVFAPINILKNKLAGMDIDFDAVAADFSKLKEILASDSIRMVDFIDYFDKAWKNENN